MPNGPIFVVGAAGSGTTVMRLILDSHDNVAIAQETGLARLLLANEAIPFWEFGDQWYGRLGLSREDLERRMADFYGGLYAEWAARRGASRWGDKTPFHVWHLDLLARVFPDATFVATVRHPGAVAHSTRRRMRHPYDAAVRYWVRDHLELVHQGATLGGQLLVVRYEDLVTDPEPVLRAVFDRLGEPWLEQVLDFHAVHGRRGTQVEVEGATRSDEPLDPSRIGAWTESMDDTRWARLTRGRAAALAAVWGYDPREPVPAPPTAPLLDGTDLARLLREHPELFRRRRRPRPSLANRPLTPAELADLRRGSAGAGDGGGGLADRLEGRFGEVGRAALHRLPPDARRQARALAQKVRR